MVGSSCGWVGREEVKRDWSVFFFFSALASTKKTKIGSVSFTSSVRERTDDMDPLSWHNRLLSCWQDQQIKNCSNPSLFRAICYAYGWPYVRLGLLKVFIYLRASFLIICWNLQEYEIKEFIDILISILILPLIPVVFFFAMLEKKT